MRRSLSAVYAALLVIVTVAVGVFVVESRTASVAANLGYAGPTAWIHVVDLGEGTRSPDDLIDVVDHMGLALAYTPSADSGLFTLHDPRGLFQGPDGPLAEPLTLAGGAPAAMVSDVLGLSRADREAVLPEGTRIVGGVDPSVGLDDATPVMIRNPAAGPFGGGMYVVAGAEVADAQHLVDVLVSDGAWIGDATTYGPVPVSPYEGLRAAVLGALLGLFVLMGILVIVLDVAHDRDRVRVGAVLGARQRDLRRMIWTQAAPRLAAGTVAGLIMVLAGLGLVLWRLMTAPQVVAATVAVAVGGAVLWCLMALGWGAWWHAWRCARDLPR